jgi:hypothetical protein
MGTHEVNVIFNGTSFAKCYFLLAEEKSVTLSRHQDGVFKGFWKDVDLRDAMGEESVRFSLVARGVPSDPCTLEILVDNKKIRTYKEKDGFQYEKNGWLSKVDVIYLNEQ